MLSVKVHGSFEKLERFLRRKKKDPTPILEYYGRAGVDALAAATPVDTGLTATSWRYEISHEDGVWTLSWHNDNIQNGIPIAVLIQMGHATKSGGWVQGIDYINPALDDIFRQLKITAERDWMEGD